MKKTLAMLSICTIMLFCYFPAVVHASTHGWVFESPIQHSYNGKNFEIHCFRGNTCWKCGYTREGSDQYNNDALVTLYKLGDTILHNSCWTMYDCPVYGSSSTESWQWGWLEYGNTYYVGDYQIIGNQMWVQLTERANDGAPVVGWVQAGNLYIDPFVHISEMPDYMLIGRSVTITASSGRGRLDAGTEYPYVATVHFGDRYTILNSKIGTNGNTWYEINVDGLNVWISSGLTKLI